MSISRVRKHPSCEWGKVTTEGQAAHHSQTKPQRRRLVDSALQTQWWASEAIGVEEGTVAKVSCLSMGLQLCDRAYLTDHYKYSIIKPTARRIMMLGGTTAPLSDRSWGSMVSTESRALLYIRWAVEVPTWTCENALPAVTVMYVTSDRLPDRTKPGPEIPAYHKVYLTNI